MFIIILFSTLMVSHEKSNSPNAYPVLEQRSSVESTRAFYVNDFEHYDLLYPWPGQGAVLWAVEENDSAYSGDHLFSGASWPSLREAWVISESFSIAEDINYISIKMQTRYWVGRNTWQIVPQGSEFVMARFIVNPDGSISVFDADSGDEATPTNGAVKLWYFDDSWDQVEFKLDRRRNRYSLLLNDQVIHRGTPFTTEVTNIVLAQTTRSASVNMHLDAIEVTEDFTNVPTLSEWGLILLCSSLGISAMWLHRRKRLRPC